MRPSVLFPHHPGDKPAQLFAHRCSDQAGISAQVAMQQAVGSVKINEEIVNRAVDNSRPGWYGVCMNSTETITRGMTMNDRKIQYAVCVGGVDYFFETKPAADHWAFEHNTIAVKVNRTIKASV